MIQNGTHNRYRYKSSFDEAIKEHLRLREGPTAFENLLAELSKLPLKYLQQLLSDLNNNGYIDPFSGDYHRILVNSVENFIMERTVLK